MAGTCVTGRSGCRERCPTSARDTEGWCDSLPFICICSLGRNGFYCTVTQYDPICLG